jgi:hypothetical protein
VWEDLKISLRSEMVYLPGSSLSEHTEKQERKLLNLASLNRGCFPLLRCIGDQNLFGPATRKYL